MVIVQERDLPDKTPARIDLLSARMYLRMKINDLRGRHSFQVLAKAPHLERFDTRVEARSLVYVLRLLEGSAARRWRYQGRES